MPGRSEKQKKSQIAEMEAFLEFTDQIGKYDYVFSQGHNRMTIFPILPGVFVTLNEVEGSEIPFDDELYSKEFTSINYCMEGRCEFRYSGENVSYLSPGLLGFGKKRHLNGFYYPQGKYTGFEIYFIERLFTRETRDYFHFFFLDYQKLKEKYLNKDNLVIGRWRRENSFSLQNLEDSVINKDLGALRLCVIEFLRTMLYENPLAPYDAHFLTESQATMGKKAMEILSANLSVHLPIRKIAEDFGISETSLKNYFREIYGTCISEYLHNLRMKTAADLLKNTSLPILEIANRVGYTNQGRFAKVFFGHFQKKPLEFRHETFSKERKERNKPETGLGSLNFT